MAILSLTTYFNPFTQHETSSPQPGYAKLNLQIEGCPDRETLSRICRVAGNNLAIFVACTAFEPIRSNIGIEYRRGLPMYPSLEESQRVGEQIKAGYDRLDKLIETCKKIEYLLHSYFSPGSTTSGLHLPPSEAKATELLRIVAEAEWDSVSKDPETKKLLEEIFPFVFKKA